MEKAGIHAISIVAICVLAILGFQQSTDAQDIRYYPGLSYWEDGRLVWYKKEGDVGREPIKRGAPNYGDFQRSELRSSGTGYEEPDMSRFTRLAKPDPKLVNSDPVPPEQVLWIDEPEDDEEEQEVTQTATSQTETSSAAPPKMAQNNESQIPAIDRKEFDPVTKATTLKPEITASAPSTWHHSAPSSPKIHFDMDAFKAGGGTFNFNPSANVFSNQKNTATSKPDQARTYGSELEQTEGSSELDDEESAVGGGDELATGGTFEVIIEDGKATIVNPSKFESSRGSIPTISNQRLPYLKPTFETPTTSPAPPLKPTSRPYPYAPWSLAESKIRGDESKGERFSSRSTSTAPPGRNYNYNSYRSRSNQEENTELPSRYDLTRSGTNQFPHLNRLMTTTQAPRPEHRFGTPEITEYAEPEEADSQAYRTPNRAQSFGSQNRPQGFGSQNRAPAFGSQNRGQGFGSAPPQDTAVKFVIDPADSKSVDVMKEYLNSFQREDVNTPSFTEVEAEAERAEAEGAEAERAEAVAESEDPDWQDSYPWQSDTTQRRPFPAYGQQYQRPVQGQRPYSYPARGGPDVATHQNGANFRNSNPNFRPQRPDVRTPGTRGGYGNTRKFKRNEDYMRSAYENEWAANPQEEYDRYAHAQRQQPFQETRPTASRDRYVCDLNTPEGKEQCRSTCSERGYIVSCAESYCYCVPLTSQVIGQDDELTQGVCGPNSEYGKYLCSSVCSIWDVQCYDKACYCKDQNPSRVSGSAHVEKEETTFGPFMFNTLDNYVYCGPANERNMCGDLCAGWGHVTCAEISCYCSRNTEE